ncbi:MAG: hypothetical protein AWU54_1898 [Candidatus Frackibacter sp. T328-2]|nr:MAG: hypothetical protein AWU54_1898 [Candidatus Frackibacter sp. T328-2]
MSNNHRKNKRSSKKKIWFQDVKPKDDKSKHNSKRNTKDKKSPKKETDNTDNMSNKREETSNEKELSFFREQLINHIDEFVKIVTTGCCPEAFEGILCKIEADFIILIDNLLIIEIPIEKITAIIRYAGGAPTNEADHTIKNTDNTPITNKKARSIPAPDSFDI